MRVLLFALSTVGVLSGCSYVDLFNTLGRYETDTTANFFLEDAACCGWGDLSYADPEPLTNRLQSTFPVGSRSIALVAYITDWGGVCNEGPNGEHHCSIVAEIFTPFGPSLTSVYRANYTVNWSGSPVIEQFVSITRSYLPSGHLREEEWYRRAEEQRMMVERLQMLPQ